MTELSPAAQAVLDAFDAKQDEMHEVTWLTRNPDRDCIAAALRAAANQMRYSDQLGLTGFGGYIQAQDQILAIADELENQ